MTERGGEKEKIKQFQMHLQAKLSCEEDRAINSLMLKMQKYPTAYMISKQTDETRPNIKLVNRGVCMLVI